MQKIIYLYAPDARIEYADSIDDGTSNLNIVFDPVEKSSHLKKLTLFRVLKCLYLDEGDGGCVDHDGHVEQHLDTEQGRGEHSDT